MDCNESPISAEVQEEFCRDLTVLYSAKFNCLIKFNNLISIGMLKVMVQNTILKNVHSENSMQVLI